MLDPDGKLAALPPPTRARALATKLDLIAASPQADLLGGFWNRGDGPRPRDGPRLRAAARPGQGGDLRARPCADAREVFGPDAYLTGLSYLLTQTTEA